MIKNKNKEFPYLVLALLCIWCPILVGFSYSQQIRVAVSSLLIQVWDKDKPASSTSLRSSNPEMLANQSALETAIAQDHEFSTGGTNSGKHEVLTMEEESSAGASSTNELHIQAIDGGTGQPELAVTSEDGDELQMTKDGDLYSSDNLQIAGTSTFTGAITCNDGITLGAGDDLIGSSTSDITFNTNKFTVAGATGNTLVAGTLNVTGVATLGDASLLATSATPTTDAMIANKKFVDDSIGTWDPTIATGMAGADDSIGEADLPNGLKLKWGKKTCAANADTTIDFTDEGLTDFTACFQAFVCVGELLGADKIAVAHTVTATSFEIHNYYVSGTRIHRWWAIGR